jgi:hypothetical protein
MKSGGSDPLLREAAYRQSRAAPDQPEWRTVKNKFWRDT